MKLLQTLKQKPCSKLLYSGAVQKWRVVSPPAPAYGAGAKPPYAALAENRRVERPANYSECIKQSNISHSLVAPARR